MSRGTPRGERPLHLALDYLPAVQHAPGVGRYVRELVRALVRLAAPPRLTLFEGGLGPRPMEGAPLGLAGAAAEVRRRRVRVPRRALAGLARLGLGAERLAAGLGPRPDLFHRVHPGAPPLSGGRHTLAIAELPAAGSALEGRLGAAARAADGVLVFDAEFGGRVAARLAVDPARVHVVPVGAEHWERELAGRGVLRRDPPELVVLGAVRAARAPLRVLAAFEALVRGGVDARLRFVGRPGDAAPAFRAALSNSRAAARVAWLEAPVEAALPELVAGATALVHLAADEGSAVTPLEALRLGPAVVASDLPAFRAALGSAARWVAPDDGAATVAERLAAALADGADEAARAARRRLAAPFTWAASAEAHLAAFRTILGGSGDGPVAAVPAPTPPSP